MLIRRVSHRITGLETEYGCLVQPPEQLEDVLNRVRDWFFKDQRYGLIDLHPRGWDEPAGNGGFLFNGGRVYLDMGHLEYCTPECATALDVVRYDRAGDLLLLEALQDLGLESRVSFVRNNVDYYTGATFGCHENYSLNRATLSGQKHQLSLLAFLTLRVLFTGAGRLGMNKLGADEFRSISEVETTPFQLSQRADYIVTDCFQWVQHSRAIINLRDEPLADSSQFRRLHLIHGDTNVLPAALFLKVGATRLVLDLWEANKMPAVALADPVRTLRELSRRAEPDWLVTQLDGTTADALDLLRCYHEKAKENFAGRDPETDAVLDLWDQCLEALGLCPGSLSGLLDWVTKKELFSQFCAQEGISWEDPWLESQDLEFHQIDPARSLGLASARTDGYWNPLQLDKAKSEAPTNSRAHARSRLMREIKGIPDPYRVDWTEVTVLNQKKTLLRNPFQTR